MFRALRTNTGAWVSLGFAAIAAGYAVIYAASPISQSHMELRRQEEIAILLAGILGVAHWFCVLRTRKPAPPGWKAEWLTVLLPVYAAFQAVPLPLWLVRLVSPARAAVVDAASPTVVMPSWAPLSVTPSDSVFHCLLLGACVVVFLVIYDIGSKLTNRPWALAVPLIALAAAEAALGLIQLTQQQKTIATGTFTIRNHYAGFLEMVLPLAAIQPIALLNRPGKALHRGGTIPVPTALLACLGFGIAALILTGVFASLSRGGFLATFVSMIFVAVTAVSRGRPWRQIWPGLASLLVVACLAVVFLPSSQLITRFNDPQASAVDRSLVWRDTFHLIAAYPIFGCGMGGYGSAFMPYKATNPDFYQDYVHNDYLQYLAELGFVGFIVAALPVALILVRLRKGWTRPPRPDFGWLCIACAGSAVAIGLHSFLDFNLYVPANMIVFSWILGMSASSGAVNPGL